MQRLDGRLEGVPSASCARGVIPIQADFDTADPDDVADGLAQNVGDPGLRIHGDFKLREIGSLIKRHPGA